MRKSDKPLESISPDFTDPAAVYVTGTEVANLKPGDAITVDAELESFPGGVFSRAGRRLSGLRPPRSRSLLHLRRPGRRRYLQQDNQRDDAGGIDGNNPVEVSPDKKVDIPSNVRVMISEPPPHGVLGPSDGYPGDSNAAAGIRRLKKEEVSDRLCDSRLRRRPPEDDRFVGGCQQADERIEDPGVIYVALNAHTSLGHHVFADSANNGPWGTALVEEFIPHLERQFRMDAKPSGRFLNGHSSGGWSTLWVMVTHPDFFGGTWSTAPDPVDFRSFTGPDLTRYPPQNAYADAQSHEYNLVRMGGKDIMLVRQYAQQERVLGYYGGQFASFNAVFSPKGPDGQPLKLFDIATGRIDASVQKEWERYDISRLLRDQWGTLGPKLKGKLHVIVGTADTFHLDEPTRLLDAELKRLGSDAVFTYVEGRNHFDLSRAASASVLRKKCTRWRGPKSDRLRLRRSVTSPLRAAAGSNSCSLYCS